MRILLIVLVVTFLAGCSPSFSLAPGSHYHCSEELNRRLGELDKAITRSESYLKNVESVCKQHGDSSI